MDDGGRGIVERERNTDDGSILSPGNRASQPYVPLIGTSWVMQQRPQRVVQHRFVHRVLLRGLRRVTGRIKRIVGQGERRVVPAGLRRVMMIGHKRRMEHGT